jgi:uncharacterized LabA/DUF88 family protein
MQPMQAYLTVLVLVDEANMTIAARRFQRRVDWLALRKFLADPDEGRRLIEMVMYVGLPPNHPNYRDKREKRQRFIRWLEQNGFLVVIKEGVPKDVDDGTYKANVDVVMAIDAMDLALSIRPDIVVLVTGDSDFAYLATQLRRRGMVVEIASDPQSQSETLRFSANGVIDLTDVIDDFPALSGQLAPAIGGTDIFDDE